jgi:O-antigen/teichoic acid export membrane protein
VSVVRLSFVDVVERHGRSRLRARPARLLDAVLAGRDAAAVSQRTALIAFLTRLVSAALAYLSQVLIARWIGDYQYGVFAVVWVGAVMLGGLSCLGFQRAVVRFVPEYQALGEADLLRGVLRHSPGQAVLTGALVSGIGLACLWAFPGLAGSLYLLPLVLAALVVPILALTELEEGIARAFDWADLALWPTYIFRPLAILAAMAAAVGLGFRADAVTALTAAVAGTYCVTLAQLLLVRRRLARVVAPGPRRYRRSAWMVIALPIFVVEGLFNLMTSVDIILVGQMRAPNEAGIYFATVKTLALINFVYYAIRAGATHRFSYYHAAGDRAGLERLVRETLQWTFWPSVAMAGFLLVAGRLLLGLFGPDFVAGYPLLFIFAAGLLVRASVGPAESLLSMAGEQRICALVYLACFLLNVSLLMLLIPRFGLAGAAIAVSLSLAAEALSLFVVVQSRFGIRCSILFAIRPAPRPAAG